MKQAIEDYKEMVFAPQFAWLREHWKGWLAFTAVCFAAPWAIIKIVEYISDLRYRKQLEKEES